MIKNFEVVRKQLKELSEVINSFKSESVQLRIVDLIFGLEEPELDDETEEDNPPKTNKTRKKKTKKAKTKKTASKKKSGSKSQSGHGAVATITALSEGDYFDKSRSINDIVSHCSTNMAKKIKPNDISGKLARLIRDGVLTRVKNKDNQYEYKKA